MVDFDEDAPEIIYCPPCEKLGFKVIMVPKVDDTENFMMCPDCGWLCPIYEIEPEAEIADTVEPAESPFESNKFVSESIPKRATEAGQKASAKKRSKKIQYHKDNEIDALMRIYGDRVKVVYDSGG